MERDVHEASNEAREQAYIEGEAYFRLLVENAYDIIAVLNADGSVRYISPSVEKVLGYGREELLGVNPFELVHPDEVQKVLELFESMRYEPGKSEVSEFRFRHKDGSWRVLDAIAKNLLAEPRIEGHVVNLRDITAYRRIEEELRESEERYRYLVENLNEVVYACDAAGRVTYISPVIERVTKYRIGEMEGQSFEKYVYPKDLPAFQEAFRRSVSGSIESVEFRFVDKDGRLIYFESSTRPRERDGETVGLVGILTEITDRKQAEEVKKRTEEMFRAQIRRTIRYYRAP